ncbi:MAG: hypothetical protein ACRC6M_15125 [Microcystaceae cyanobacterium]
MKIKSLALIAGLAWLGSTIPGAWIPARAIVLTIGGQEYNVTTFEDSYDNQVATFNTEANGGEMPWWEDQDLAREFATAIGEQLGAPNNFGGVNGPWFAFTYKPSEILQQPSVVWTEAFLKDAPPNTPKTLTIIPAANETRVFAKAVKTPWETDALPIAGGVILFAGGIWAKRKFAQPFDKN